jgi:hypothetical protein
MIRLNLIEAAERASVAGETVTPVHVTDVAAQVKTSKKKTLVGLLAALFVFVAFSCFLSVFGVPKPLQGALPEPYLSLIGAEDPSRSALSLGAGQMTTAGGTLEAQQMAAMAEAKRREAMTVKGLVGAINHQALFNTKRLDYTSYLPLEKLSFQRTAVNQFFTFMSTATPDDVGFSDCVFEAPNYYYVRGSAVKPTSQRTFLDRLKTVSGNFKTPPLPENAPATDITAFGEFNVTGPNLAAITSFVPAAEAASEVKSLKALATTNKVVLSGMDKPAIEDLGVYKRYTFTATSPADYVDLQAFVAALADSPIRASIRKADLKFVKKDLLSTLYIVMLVGQ